MQKQSDKRNKATRYRSSPVAIRITALPMTSAGASRLLGLVGIWRPLQVKKANLHEICLTTSEGTPMARERATKPSNRKDEEPPSSTTSW